MICLSDAFRGYVGIASTRENLESIRFQEISNCVSDREDFGLFLLHNRLLPGRELLPELLRLHFKLGLPPLIAVKLKQRPRFARVRTQRKPFAAVAGNVLATFNNGWGLCFG